MSCCLFTFSFKKKNYVKKKCEKVAMRALVRINNNNDYDSFEHWCRVLNALKAQLQNIDYISSSAFHYSFYKFSMEVNSNF